MAARSLGVLTAFINADAAGMLSEFNKVDRVIARNSKAWTQPGAKLALGFIGVQNALSAVTNEVRSVIANVEKIPGVPATAQASIIEMRSNLAGAKNTIDRMTAGIVAFGVQAAQAVGVGFASLMGYDDTSGLSKTQSADDIARAVDPGYDDKIEGARKKLADASAAAKLAAKSEAEQIIALREQAAHLEQLSVAGNAVTTVQSLERKTEAQEKLRDASAKMAAINKQLADSEDEVKKSMTGVYTASVSRADAIEALQNRSTDIALEKANLSLDPNDPDAVVKRIALNKELAVTQKELGTLYEKNAAVGRAVGEVIAGGFEDAIFAGKGLGEILKSLLVDIAKMVIHKSIVNSVAGMFSGAAGAGIAKFFGGFFADGGRPAPGKVAIVGERGPELFIPDSAGRIISNAAATDESGPEYFTAFPMAAPAQI